MSRRVLETPGIRGRDLHHPPGGPPLPETGSGYVHVLGYVRMRVPGLVIRPGRASPG